MSTSEKLVLGSQLRQARLAAGRTEEEIAESLGVSPSSIASWETDADEPSLSELERLAELYSRHLDYFLRETTAPPTGIHFRTTSRDKTQDLPRYVGPAVAKLDELCRTAFELESLLGESLKREFCVAGDDTEPKALANTERKRLGYDHGPIGYFKGLREKLEAQGIRIFVIDIGTEAISGLSWIHDEYGPCILIASWQSAGRRNFTLAHEYAHLLYQHAPSACDISKELGTYSSSEERKANLFAVNFLLPATAVESDFRARQLSAEPSLDDLAPMYRKWGVSSQALVYRLGEIGLISQSWVNHLLPLSEPEIKFVQKKGARRTPKWETRLGKRFIGTAQKAYKEGIVSAGRLASLFDVNVPKAMEILAKE